MELFPKMTSTSNAFYEETPHVRQSHLSDRHRQRPAGRAEQGLCHYDDRAHLAKVEITDNGPVPLTRREALRASGPSIAFGAAALVPAAIAAE